jgi:hypothetical protein
MGSLLAAGRHMCWKRLDEPLSTTLIPIAQAAAMRLRSNAGPGEHRPRRAARARDPGGNCRNHGRVAAGGDSRMRNSAPSITVGKGIERRPPTGDNSFDPCRLVTRSLDRDQRSWHPPVSIYPQAGSRLAAALGKHFASVPATRLDGMRLAASRAVAGPHPLCPPSCAISLGAFAVSSARSCLEHSPGTLAVAPGCVPPALRWPDRGCFRRSGSGRLGPTPHRPDESTRNGLRPQWP